MTEFSLSILVGALLSAALIASALLGWLADLKRVGASTSARETTRRATTRERPRRTAFSGAAPSGRPRRPSASREDPARRASQREQEERIRDAYFAKERKAREVRERRRREQARARRAQASTGGRQRQSAPSRPQGTEEARHRTTLELTGPITPQSVRTAYRRLIAAYHPDRCATLGTKLQHLAEEETKRINEAYAYFRRMLK
ncbi:MAG: J domain-containing protein [Bacteroidota bacterium]